MNNPFITIDPHIVKDKKLPREICVATMDVKDYRPAWPDKTRDARVKRMLVRMNEVISMHPDIVCLPELFDSMWVEEPLNISEIAEDEKVPGPVTSRIAAFAK